jgi:hypothetical protein
MSQALTTTAAATPSTGVLTNAGNTASTQTTYPMDQGGTLSWGSQVGITTAGAQGVLFSSGISTTELNYKNRLTTTSGTSLTGDGADLYSDFQNFVALWCRVGSATPGLAGLSNVVFSTVGSAQGATSPSVQMTPRAVIFRIQQMCNTMLANPNV